ncbi:NUDIX hydrolase [Mesorhizobium xinjiangense]|uniref:NUDIX hydrolase n=1 Tax=Mesorhizobium xinjiangense TaxID=2678685 RepID=UPI0012ED646A|nr:NUDIX hydrolase [Mesorhizobium xinjiangense]
MLVNNRTWHHSIERLRRLLGGAPSRVQVAALPYRLVDGETEIMLITSKDTGRWVLPKGWPEGDEAGHDAAGREAMEEAGIRGAIAKDETGRYFYGKGLRSGLKQRCEVIVFPLAVEQVSSKWPEKGERLRRWFKPHEAARVVNEPDLAEILADFHPAKIRP